MANTKAQHHRGPHQRIARIVTAAANSDPTYTCPTCGLTLAQGIARWGTNGKWEAGHKVHGRSDLGYYAEHRHCNRSAGAAHGNKLRVEPHSERW